MPTNYILFDDSITRQQLLPLTFTRPIADIRMGITTIREKWEFYLKQETSTLCPDYLAGKFPLKTTEDNLFINASILPNPILVSQILRLQAEQSIVHNSVLIAARVDEKHPYFLHKADGQMILLTEDYLQLEPKANYLKINHWWDIFGKNAEVLKSDFERLTKNKKTQSISATNTLICPDKIFVEEGAKIEGAFLNASKGPIFIGKNAEVMEGSLVRGPFAMCENAVLKMGAKIYGATTLGPFVKVGGEVNNSVLIGYSNKSHDGFLGNSVLGEWCNLGADTNNSNLKNNYGMVRVWDYATGKQVSTEKQFCGLLMGDHAKCGINTMFNTGTTVGTCANVFGGGFPPKFIPSFAWGGSDGFDTYQLKKALETAARVYARRNKNFTKQDTNILTAVFKATEKYRNK